MKNRYSAEEMLHRGLKERGLAGLDSECSIKIRKIEQDIVFHSPEEQQEHEEKIIQDLIDMIETKDPYTQGHSHHVKVVAEAIYDCLPRRHQEKVDKKKLLNAALLHDVGKILVPDHILNKESALTADEWIVMEKHPDYSREILQNTCFRGLNDWILYHHERLDGNGYYGLQGHNIPLESRIIAIADLPSVSPGHEHRKNCRHFKRGQRHTT